MKENIDFESENILRNSKIQLKEGLELNSDYNLPDYIDDIRKLDRYEAKVVLHNIFNNGSALQCEGEVIYNILVICEDESIKNIIYSEDFTFSVPLKDNITAENEIFCRIVSPQVRLTTQRRINCRSRVNLYERGCNEISLSVSTDNSDSIERLTDKLKAVTEEVHHEYNLHASHDIELSSGTPEINNIVYCRVNSYINEIKHIDTQLALRGETRVEILYEGEEGEYHYISRSLPYSELTASYFDNAYPCLCRIDIKDIKVSVQNNSFGEMRIFELDYSYDIEEIYYITKDIEITRDAYCTDKCSEIITDRFEYKQFTEAFNTSIKLDEIKEIPDYDEYLPTEIIDTFCDIRGCETAYDREGGKHTIVGECELKLICLCRNDEGATHYNISYSMPFKFEKEALYAIDNASYDHEINISGCQCNIEKGKLHIIAEMNFNCIICDIKETDKVCELKQTNEVFVQSSPITLYYPKNGDTLWNIAKKYRCKANNIIMANSIKDNDISEIKVLLIPRA